ncbi:MAG TPA: N-acetylneuraminate synthase family protein [Candidatus Paceibacterota bacterium]
MKAKTGKTIRIPGTKKSLNKDEVFVIAEIGKNFIDSKRDESVDVYIENAKQLITAAKEAGVDAVKFQTHEVEDEQLDVKVVSPHFDGADRYSWVKKNTDATPPRFWQEIKSHADKEGIIFFSTPMSRKAAEKLQALDMPLWKVGSGDVQDYRMLDFQIETKKPIIISSGMVSLAELDRVIEHLKSKHASFAVLYCVSQYPCPREAFNLGTIEYLKEKYPNLIIGFSDHSVGDDTVMLAAVKLGARIIEKHFSFSRKLWGSDHKVSMTPDEMKKMVGKIRDGSYKNVDERLFYGEKHKELEGAENKFRPYFNKALVAGRDIKRGDVVTKEALYSMRPLMHIKGERADRFYDIVGKCAKRNLKKFEPIKARDFE